MLFSKLKLEKKHRSVNRTVNRVGNKKAMQPILDANHHYVAASQQYGQKLPELEVSITSDQDIATFTNSPFLKDLMLKTTTNKPLITNPVINKKKLKPAPEQTKTHKAILNHYIDDFFSASQATEMQQSTPSNFLNLSVNTPVNDEVIIVNEPSKMV
jgi:hypothetical protein